MSKPAPATVACIGGVSLDRRASTSGPLRPGTSNPIVSLLRPGGVARNVADALARLGCQVALFSIVGDDEPGRSLLDGLAEVGVDTSGVTRSRRQATGAYTAVLGPSGRLEFGLADMGIFEEADAVWARGIAGQLAERRIWFVDANLPTEALSVLLDPKPEDVTVLADPVSVAKADRLRPVLRSIDVVFPSRQEAERLSRMPIAGPEQVAAAAERVREMGVGAVVVTLGSEGVLVTSDSGTVAVAAIAPHGPLSDPTGAGDALIAGYVFGLSREEPNPLRLGLAAASLVLEAGGALTGLSARAVIQRAEEA